MPEALNPSSASASKERHSQTCELLSRSCVLTTGFFREPTKMVYPRKVKGRPDRPRGCTPQHPQRATGQPPKSPRSRPPPQGARARRPGSALVLPLKTWFSEVGLLYLGPTLNPWRGAKLVFSAIQAAFARVTGLRAPFAAAPAAAQHFVASPVRPGCWHYAASARASIGRAASLRGSPRRTRLQSLGRVPHRIPLVAARAPGRRGFGK